MIGSLLYFSLPEKRYQGKLKTKIEMIMEQKQPIELLVNPEQVSNMFIRHLASICVMQHTHSEVLRDAGSNPDIKYTRALRYEASCQAYALDGTSNKLRDGCYPLQPVTEFQTIVGAGREGLETGFWYAFLTRCIDENKVSYESGTTDRFAYLAAFVFKNYKPGLSAEIFASGVLDGLYANDASTGKRPKENDTRILPNSSEMDKLVTGTKTFKDLLTKLRFGEIQFVIHLCYTITQINNAELSDTGSEAIMQKSRAAELAKPAAEAPVAAPVPAVAAPNPAAVAVPTAAAPVAPAVAAPKPVEAPVAPAPAPAPAVAAPVAPAAASSSQFKLKSTVTKSRSKSPKKSN